MNARAVERLNLGLPNDPFSIQTAAFQADISYHRRVLLLARAAGVALTLPKANGSGLQLQITVGVVSTTSPYYTILTKPTTDILQGSIGINIDASTAAAFKTATDTNKITLNGTTQGGVTIGDTIYLTDIQPGVWAVSADVIGSGSVVTPFAHV